MASATAITATPPSSANLTSKDAAVLQALFDAESSPSPSSSNVVIDPSLPSFPTVSESDLVTLKERELHAIRQIQQSSSSSSSSTPSSRETIEAAIAELDALIAEFPSYPSAYVNRAQALRVLIEVKSQESSSESKSTDKDADAADEDKDNALFCPSNIRLTTRLFSDLGQAIALATPASSSQNNYRITVSPAQARILADAHTHRGYLLLKAAKQKRTSQEKKGGPEQLHNIDCKDQLEEMASRDFYLGGRYGNKVAQQLAVQTNPYAKMCGAIVKEALRKEIEENTV
ncbi:hypothetical protein VTN77DRAFT_3689 [Rasamsonia byssochlamydoides]|uniref:uncharacterized protein n=1 Tax=Rasamsonia byssochlamydoides TaxID=89139 RepID=UPI0037444D55